MTNHALNVVGETRFHPLGERGTVLVVQPIWTRSFGDKNENKPPLGQVAIMNLRAPSNVEPAHWGLLGKGGAIETCACTNCCGFTSVVRAIGAGD